ncbi:MAG: pectate lyase [Cyclobacteriaceae bacterium]|nr:MAG: pectate lyase [Cyclobacteriaceae bacterium]
MFYNLIAVLVTAMIIGCSDDSIEPPATQNPPILPGGSGDPLGSADILAFPGAQGYGAFTPGGRGGRVIAVTNLNDRGPGSLREACAADEPRIIVFHVGGTINLTSPVDIQSPFVTIAGQTAPGDGICLRGVGLDIATNNVIVRGIRVRVGDDPNGPDPGKRDGISLGATISNNTYNVIVDHCSISWGIDENTSINNNVHDVTFQWNIISEGLQFSLHPKGPHSKGMLIGKNNVNRVSVHHNYFANNHARNPKIALDVSCEIVNNVVYNYGSAATLLAPGARVNAIGNFYMAGPNTERENSTLDLVKGIVLDSRSGSDFMLYVKGNLGPGRDSNESDEWDIVFGDDSEQYRSLEPVPDVEQTGIEEMPVENLVDVVLAGAGAIIPALDPIDRRVIQGFYDQNGAIINSQDEVGGWVEMDPGTEVIDTDKDGIPDNWEQENGLNPNDAADGKLDSDNDGYSNIEEYLNHFYGT